MMGLDKKQKTAKIWFIEHLEFGPEFSQFVSMWIMVQLSRVAVERRPANTPLWPMLEGWIIICPAAVVLLCCCAVAVALPDAGNCAPDNYGVWRPRWYNTDSARTSCSIKQREWMKEAFKSPVYGLASLTCMWLSSQPYLGWRGPTKPNKYFPKSIAITFILSAAAGSRRVLCVMRRRIQRQYKGNTQTMPGTARCPPLPPPLRSWPSAVTPLLRYCYNIVIGTIHQLFIQSDNFLLDTYQSPHRTDRILH